MSEPLPNGSQQAVSPARSASVDAAGATALADVTWFDRLGEEQARARLLTCLAVPRWAEEVVAGRPYADRDDLLAHAAAAAGELTEAELEAALSRHPRIGERAGPGHDEASSAREQAAVDASDSDLAGRLARGNRAYEERFGRVFLVRAAGRTGPEVLAELERRLGNDAATERAETVQNLREIALLRLEGIL